jgi:predicted ATP-grasp superfamily ATP-dependent carboligase
MNDLIKLWERPVAEEKYMIAGWHQWADAGVISSGLPQYLISQTGARKIGEIKPHGFYMFQVPGMHGFLRPEIKLEEGYRKELTSRNNEFFYIGDDRKGLVIFLGQEPHLNIEGYAEAFFDAVQALGVKRVAVVGGVFAAVPYDRDRDVSCVYSLRGMKDELARYAVKFSDYEGGVSIGTYLADRAEQRGIEYLSFYAFVPAYDLSQISEQLQGIGIETDLRAWHELMRRFNRMFGLRFDLSNLAQQSAELTSTMNDKISELERKHPKVREYMDKLAQDFSETPYTPLDDVWEQALGDMLDE